MTAAVSRRYLAVHLPFLPSERIGRTAPPDTPFALTAKHRSAMRLIALDRAALALGLVAGMTLADARARVPDLAALPYDAAADARALARLADGCERYTPMVATDAGDTLLLDITGCAHLFTGFEEGLAADLLARLRGAGFTVSHAIAATADAASALARHQESDIHALPVEALRVDDEAHRALRRAGLRTLGDLATRPTAPLAARFGSDLVDLLDRLLERQDIRIVPRRGAPDISVETRFAEPIARTEDVLATLLHLAAQAGDRLAERGQGGRAFAASLFRSDGHVARLEVETGQPVRDVATLDRLLRERIDALSDPLDPGYGYDLIRLDVLASEAMAAEQLRLDGGRVAEQEMALLIDRLAVRLGRGRVRRFVPRDTHIPEQAAFALPIADAPRDCDWPAPDPGEPPLRPIHLFDPPQKIEVLAAVPDGPPRRFKWRRGLHEVVRQEGPERIAAEWWRRADGKGLTRDYYRVEDARGRRYWLFRHGLFGTEKANPDWYIHGLFA